MTRSSEVTPSEPGHEEQRVEVTGHEETNGEPYEASDLEVQVCMWNVTLTCVNVGSPSPN